MGQPPRIPQPPFLPFKPHVVLLATFLSQTLQLQAQGLLNESTDFSAILSAGEVSFKACRGNPHVMENPSLQAFRQCPRKNISKLGTSLKKNVILLLTNAVDDEIILKVPFLGVQESRIGFGPKNEIVFFRSQKNNLPWRKEIVGSPRMLVSCQLF